jgi:hypothetical protein
MQRRNGKAATLARYDEVIEAAILRNDWARSRQAARQSARSAEPGSDGDAEVELAPVRAALARWPL